MLPSERRRPLIERMDELEAQGFGCKGCQGNCCTFEANSMMVTPLEALELMAYLQKEKLDTPDLKLKCEETVRTYRLDQQLGNGKKSMLRRTYTCPFFGHIELGCPLPRFIKPFGCLAFNAHHAEKKAKEYCYSEMELLQEREKIDASEGRKNMEIRDHLKIWWEKSPIPVALLDLWDKDLTFFDQESR